VPEPADTVDSRTTWFTPGVRGIGAASLLSDLGHEVPTALLPSLLTSTLGAPASALGIIEGVADACAGIARFAGGALADDPSRRRSVAVGGYASTAVLSSLIGVATSVWQVGILRSGAWASRGLRVPARNALLADVVAPQAYGRAYGFERFMDNLGAVGGPLLALGLVAALGVRTAILVSVIPGVLAAMAIVYAIRRTARPTTRTRQRIQFRVRPLLRGSLGRLLAAMAAFEVGNVAATFFILRATALLESGYGQNRAVELALLLYVLYNAAATIVSIPAGRVGDRHGHVVVLAAGVACFFVAFLGFAAASSAGVVLVIAFIAAGAGIGFAETGENAAVAGLAPTQLRGSAFGLLAAIQSVGNLAASAIAGILWTIYSPATAFLYLAVWMLIALGLLGTLARRSRLAPRQ
jgi:MFS family permease